MKIVERVLEKKLCGIVAVNELKFVIPIKKGTIDTAFITKRLQEEYHAKGKVFYVSSGPRESF